MKINQMNRVGEQSRTGSQSTFVSPNLVRVREMLDREGNVIDPRTKVVIKKANAND